jgi:uracil-DNA glycosylase
MDARKPIAKLEEEWSACTACPLGVTRLATNGQFVFGEGVPRGILFIGDGPRREDEKAGRPFMDDAGQYVLRNILTMFKFTHYYMTYSVACHSCSPMTLPDGSPRLTKSFGGRPSVPMYKDEPPTPSERNACAPRLNELIYLLDPLIIMTLGARATEALTRKSAVGVPQHLSIPGASPRATFTGKGAWARKVGGKTVTPTEQNEVQYLLIPTLHPWHVLHQKDNKKLGNLTRQFAGHLRKAIKIYERYMFEVLNTVVDVNDASDEEVETTVDQAQQEEDT